MISKTNISERKLTNKTGVSHVKAVLVGLTFIRMLHAIVPSAYFPVVTVNKSNDYSQTHNTELQISSAGFERKSFFKVY